MKYIIDSSKKYWTIWIALFLAFSPVQVLAAPIILNTETNTVLQTPIITWKEHRDAQVIKQNFDYSCGASSLSTILTYFYNNPISEKQILDDMKLTDMMASFQDLAEVSKRYQFTAKGVATNYDSLKKLKIPAIVYLNHKRSDHFSVVKAINDSHIVLADSSWGNRVLTRAQFEKMWHTRQEDSLKGSILLILPSNSKQKDNININFTRIEDTKKLLNQSPELFRTLM